MIAIFEKEIKSYFNNITGYVFIAFMLLFSGIYTMAINLKGAYPNFEYVLSNMSFIYVIIIPVLTMRVISEERKQKTDQLLYSLPTGMTKIVIGKYFAMLTVLIVPVLIMSAYPLILSMYGTVHFKTAYSTIAGFYFLGAGLIAMGMFLSSLTENQALSAAMSFVAVLVNYFIKDLSQDVSGTSAASFIAFSFLVIIFSIIYGLMTRNIIFASIISIVLEVLLTAIFLLQPAKLEGLFPQIMDKLSLFEQFYIFVNGMFDITSIIYFLTVICVFIYLTIQSLEKRRWS